ncbi:MAG: EscU/YscU/HrcU family type III secretion system export apparatus switch protein [Deltaproteobacteria bacterium]|nr:EscU/YscU/HrcU family type III secretion system export apparatus switch protein [Deltaproteobacteria bacterium]
MSDESRRTEKPTEKRKSEFTKKGNVPRSRDITSVAALLGGAVVGIKMVGYSGTALFGFAENTFAHLDSSLDSVGPQMVRVLLQVAMPTALGAVTCALVVGTVQLGWPPALRFPSPDFSRVFTVTGLGGVLSPKAIATRTVFAVAKFAVVALAAFMAARDEYERFHQSPALESRELFGRLLGGITHLASYAVLALGALAVLDYLQNRQSLTKKMMMTKDEVKREHREQEGDPQIKSKRRRKMRELVKKRIALAVKKADVVLVNPTQYAVALRYLAGKDRAPKVLAKGRGPLADKIRELARQAGIPIVPDPPLCRMIYKLVPDGKEIPATLYKAVAEVLAYVYRLRRRSR